MFKKLKEQKGFTLAELLVVVAIIGVLVAISIPIFTGQLEKSRDAVTVANLRSAYAEAQTTYLTESNTGNATYKAVDTAGAATVEVSGVVAKGKKEDDTAFRGLDKELPFYGLAGNDYNAMDNGGAAENNKFTVTFTYGTDGEITGVKAEAAAE